ncbi:MAG: DUF202 domain-containing protein [DPANN group archaeon]|nr:DUF202 domain-containing protein [DPANN group archaeon]
MASRQLVLLEEQTILSRERTMQQYIATGLAFIGVGLLVARFFLGPVYTAMSAALIAIGFWQIYAAYKRFERYRCLAKKLRKKERKFGMEIGE